MFSAKPFADRQLWSQHLELDHQLGPSWESVTCPLCLEATDAGKSKMLIHFARHMEDIALAALPREVESDNEAENETDDASHRSAGSLILSTGGDKVENEQDVTHMNWGDIGVERTIEPLRFSRSFDGTARGQSMELEEAGKQDDPALSKFLTTSSINPDKVHPLWASMGSLSCRCKVWELKNKDWLDRGTGYAKVMENEQAQWNITVYSEDRVIPNLLLTPISLSGGYQMRKDTLIVWTEPDGTDMALSFETPEGCHKVWDIINEVQGAAMAQKLVTAPDRSHKSQAVGASAPIADSEITASHQERQQLHLRQLVAQEQALQQDQLVRNEVIRAAKSAQQTSNQILQKSTGLIDATDQQPYPRSIILDDIKPYIPPEVNTWRDIKQWATSNEKMINLEELLRLQEMQYLTQEQKQNESAPRQSLEADTIKCICGYSDDDGNTVLCELCNSWQHIVCYYAYSSHVPDVHECVDCSPRPIDREVAARVQRMRREHPTEDIRNEEEVRKAARKIEIERRCQQMNPPIPPEVLRHMESFKASIQIAHPLNDESWTTLEPRLVSQLAAAKKRAMRTIPTSASKRLQTWLMGNMSNPYPSRSTKLMLAQECGITEKQVSTWFTNARTRKLHGGSDKTGTKLTLAQEFGIAEKQPSPKASSPKFLQGKQQENITHQSAGDAVEESAIPIACDACQRRQITCDGRRPYCLRCIDSGRECLYSKTVWIRKKGLTAEQRAAAAHMRRIGSCASCTIRKVKCDPGTPCKPCLIYYRDDMINHPCLDKRGIRRPSTKLISAHEAMEGKEEALRASSPSPSPPSPHDTSLLSEDEMIKIQTVADKLEASARLTKRNGSNATGDLFASTAVVSGQGLPESFSSDNFWKGKDPHSSRNFDMSADGKSYNSDIHHSTTALMSLKQALMDQGDDVPDSARFKRHSIPIGHQTPAGAFGLEFEANVNPAIHSKTSR